MKRKTNFDLYLEEQLKDADFAVRFRKAGEAWDVAKVRGRIFNLDGIPGTPYLNERRVRSFF